MDPHTRSTLCDASSAQPRPLTSGERTARLRALQLAQGAGEAQSGTEARSDTKESAEIESATSAAVAADPIEPAAPRRPVAAIKPLRAVSRHAEALPVSPHSMEYRPLNTITSALYIDFDNIFLSLRNTNEAAAERFARDPGVWLDWFIRGGHHLSGNSAGIAERHRVQVRRCYLTPERFLRYRANFVRAGFSVIDCPSLTTRGKNGADICMTLDICDALDHRTTRYDEFIILSSDADFTPVLTRVREHDRYSTIITNTVTAAALRAVSDRAIEESLFIREALGIAVDGDAKARLGSAIRNALDQSENGAVLLSAFGEKLNGLKEELVNSKYCGRGSLLKLLQSSDIPETYKLAVAGNRVTIYDPGRWIEPDGGDPAGTPPRRPDPANGYREAA